MRFGVSSIHISEGSCNYDRLSIFSSGGVPDGATCTSFFPVLFFNPNCSDSCMSFLPVGIFVLGIVSISFCSCSRCVFPSCGIFLSLFVPILVLEFSVDSFF